MKEVTRKLVRSISVRPIIGWPVRFLVAIVYLPRIRDMIFEIKLQCNNEINHINHEIDHINHEIDHINHEMNRISCEINKINLQINHINLQQKIFDTEYLPSLNELLDYQDNLKKSLPVVLRQQVRKSLELEK